MLMELQYQVKLFTLGDSRKSLSSKFLPLMKKNIKLLLITFLICGTANAQKSDSTHTHYAFYRGFSTHETELKSKRGILNGEYKIYNGKSVGAQGIYLNNKKIGRWQFFLNKDTVEQVYNYTSKKVEFNLPSKRITYYLETIEEGDIVIYPVKVMGSLGLYLLTRFYKPPYEIQKSIGEYELYYIFTIDEKGQLVKYETKIASLNYNKVEEINLKRLKPEDLEFSPAMVNGKNVSSTMVVSSKIIASKRN